MDEEPIFNPLGDKDQLSDPSTPTQQFSSIFLNTNEANKIMQRKFIPVVGAKRPSPFVETVSDTSPLKRYEAVRTSQSNALEAESKLNEAYQLVIDAAALAKGDRKRQDKVLELVGLFRAFREDKALPTATAKIEKQVYALEGSVAKLTKLIDNRNNPTGTQKGQNPTFASILSGGDPAVRTQTTTLRQNSTPPTLTSSQPRVGQTTTNGTKTDSRKAYRKRNGCRIVFGIANNTTPLDIIATRDTVNRAFSVANLYPGHPILLGTRLSEKGNLVLTLRDEKAKEILEKNLTLLRTIVPVLQVLEDNSWHKVVVHGIDPIAFKEDGPQKVAAELVAFNKGFNLANTPLWLTSEEKRLSQMQGSMLLAFKTSEEATKARKDGLWIGAKHLRVQRALSKEEREEKQKGKLASPGC